ncbi:hypothetical protein Bca52824_017569 [Brassica carinata]|uniref:Uncharacterized protein n=1 Tax=Brassica carinata TaxID=52824 RepID=A0A8X7VNM1_BRACI|nr:hypothetical protein Bca52824_017569 [Brassica carinata]
MLEPCRFIFSATAPRRTSDQKHRRTSNGRRRSSISSHGGNRILIAFHSLSGFFFQVKRQPKNLDAG